ncbi:MAG: hypothetical protein EBS50_10185 [Sphingomonadaceae bacterium]|nr:hypothetical protein [Sphingomonadaceae bacterium]
MQLPGTAVALESKQVRHKFTHFELQAEVARYVIKSTSQPVALNRHRELDAYPLADTEDLALPTPWRKLLVAERDAEDH